MHILFLSNNFPRPDQPGVPRPWQMAKYWVNQGYKVTVVVNARHYMEVGDKSISNKQSKFIRRYREGGLNVIEVMTTAGKRLSIARRILNYLTFALMSLIASLSVKDIDLLYVRTPPILSSFSGYVLSKLKKAKFILEIGDLHPDESVALGLVKNPVLIKIWECWENFFRKRAQLIVAVVPGIKRLLLEKGFSANAIKVITNAYDAPQETEISNELSPQLRELLKTKESYIVGYAGSMGKAIALDCIVDAARIIQKQNLTPIRFVFIGDGDNKSDLQEKCRTKEIKNCIFFDPIPSSQIFPVLSSMDVLFHSVYAGDFHAYNLPNKIFTYLGAGKPILFSGTGDIAEIINFAKCGAVVPPEWPEKIAAQVVEMYENKESYKTAGERGFEYVKANFNRIKLLEQLDKMINQIVSQ
jgi:glycosyltransferase involved in cell wall biosynthesis